MTHMSYLWCRAVPSPLSSAGTPVLPQHEGGDAVGRANSDKEQGVPVPALGCAKCHRALSSRLCWKTPWDKWPGGTRASDMALASNPGLLRAHCWIHAKYKGHIFYCFIISLKLKIFRLECNIILLENEHLFPPAEGLENCRQVYVNESVVAFIFKMQDE